MRRLLMLFSLLLVLTPALASAQSNDFSAGQRVLVTSAGTLRSGPNVTERALAPVSPGDELQILADSPAENDGVFWWNVRLADQQLDGWLPDAVLGPKYLVATPDPGVRGAGPCDALDAYATNYQSQFAIVSAQHPDAEAILEQATLTQMTAEAFAASLSPDDMTLLGAYYTAFATAMDELDPPAFAQEWHELQRQSFVVTGQIYTDASTYGIAAAGGMHSQETFPIIAGLNALFAEPNQCPAFLTWAYAMSAYRDLITKPE